MVRLASLLGVAVLTGMLVIEATMRPAGADRMVFGIALATAALFGFISTPVLSWLARHTRRFKTSMVLVALSGLVAAVALAGVASAGMYASSHDLKLTIIALGTGVLLSIAQLHVLSDALSADLGRIDRAVGELVDGSLDSRTGVDRSDELGETARSIDALAVQLSELDRRQVANDKSRRELFANIGHDLRTPLTSMSVAVEALADGLAPDPDAYLRSIGRDVAHLSRLVDDLFLTARLDADALDLELEPYDLRELADEVLEGLTPLADRAGIGLTMDGADTQMVSIDAVVFSRCLRNLVDNAIRHAKESVLIRFASTPESVVLDVVDDGDGFGDLGDSHFDRFVRAEDARQRDGSGAGLGLSICRGICRAHSGSIEIVDGIGGIVRVRLPRHALLARGYGLSS